MSTLSTWMTLQVSHVYYPFYYLYCMRMCILLTAVNYAGNLMDFVVIFSKCLSGGYYLVEI